MSHYLSYRSSFFIFLPCPLASSPSPVYYGLMNKHWFFVLVVAIMLTWVVMAAIPVRAAAPTEISTAIDLSLTQLQARDYNAARATLDALPAPPTPNALLLAARGTVELTAANTVAAEPLFRASLAANPTQLSALWGLSICLLQQRRLYETALLLNHATKLAPDDAQVKALHAYLYLSLGMTTDAAIAGKAALDGGVRAPVLMATLAQVHANMHLPDKAVEFGDMAAQSFHIGDLTTLASGNFLPLIVAASDTPAKLSPVTAPADNAMIGFTGGTPVPLTGALNILAPVDHSTLVGTQTVLARCTVSPHLLALFVDGELCGAATHAPYRISWDADAIPAGTHALTARAYDAFGMPIAEAKISIITTGNVLSMAHLIDEPTRRLEKRMMAATLPLPSPLSLFTNLCLWNMALKDNVRTLDALELAVALDPTNVNLITTLQRLYREESAATPFANDPVRMGPATTKSVALTFDGDLLPASCPAILSALAHTGAHATFFLAGNSLQQNPLLAQDLVANGQEIGNSGYHRLELVKLSPADFLREVLWNRALIKEVAGQDTNLYRMMDVKPANAVVEQLQALHYRLIGWNIDIKDDITRTPTEQVAHIMASVQSGSILRLSAESTRLLPILLAELHQHGYNCMTVSGLLKN